MRRSLVLVAWFASACGAPPGGADDPVKVVVPPQPAQVPPPVVVAPVPPAPVAVPPFTCSGLSAFANNRPYCAYGDALPWERAEARCVASGGHLLSLESRKVSDEVHLAFGTPIGVFGRAMWIGLEVVDKKRKTWKWTSGEPVAYGRWHDGEPNDFEGHESCGELLTVDGRWNDTRCDLRQPYLCQSVGKKSLDCNGGRLFTGTQTDSYCYVEHLASFPEAKKGCAQRGGVLASIRSEASSIEIDHQLGQRFRVPRMWIGLNDLEAQGVWSWTSGSKAHFTGWKPGEPNSAFGHEPCVELFTDSWQWNDLDCGVPLPSVCEGPLKVE